LLKKTLNILTVSCALLCAGCGNKIMTEDDILSKAAKIHNDALTIDTHVDIDGPHYATKELDPGVDNPNLRCDLTKMENGGMDGVFLAVFIGQRPDFGIEAYKKVHNDALERFEAIHRLPAMYPDRCELATSPSAARKVVQSGKRAIMIGLENGYPIGDNLSHISDYYDLGARYITLCHTKHNQICDSSSPAEAKHNGLSGFGQEVVAEMNRLGMMVDASHASEKSFYDMIEHSVAPIICSHSGCTSVRDHDRNLTDEQLRALAQNGGVIQIVGLGHYLKAESEEHANATTALWNELELPSRQELWNLSAEERKIWEPKIDEYRARRKEIEKTIPGQTLTDFMDHLDHAVKIAGIDHVGIGTDFDGGGGISGFDNHGEALNVTIELVRRGYSEKDIRKIWGENLMRVWSRVENQ
jgi:membrane dipeptidase